jgi:hypothetical protein
MSTAAIPPSTSEQQTTQQPAPQDRLMQLSMGHLVSGALAVMAELRIADQLENGPRSTSELAQATGARADILGRMMRSLEMVGLFARAQDGRWMLTPVSDVLRTKHPQSLHRVVLWGTSPGHFHIYAHALHTAMTGQPGIEQATGAGCFEALARDPREQNSFNDAMTALSEAMMPAILAEYDFSSIGTLVDVAGGHGFVLSSILARNPKMRGMLYELEHVAGGARRRFSEMGLSERTQVVIGNMFESVPAGGDAYIMKHILHDWDDAKVGQLLRNIRKAMNAQKGKLILLESVVPESAEPHFSKMIDLEMMMYPGGKERTESEWRELMAASGFHLARIVPTKSPLCVIEAVAR